MDASQMVQPQISVEWPRRGLEGTNHISEVQGYATGVDTGRGSNLGSRIRSFGMSILEVSGVDPRVPKSVVWRFIYILNQYPGMDRSEVV